MGAGCFKQYPEEHLQAEQILKEGKKQMQSEIKLLLLGAGESGKSTIAKQMKIIHMQGWSEQERLEYKNTITENILAAMLAIITGTERYPYTLSAEAQADAMVLTESFPKRHALDIETLDDAHKEKIRALWKEASVRHAYETYSAKLQLASSTEYFMDSMDRIFDPDYIPSDQDILRARRATTGIHTIEFTSKNVTFKCVDVGGQRTERRKWLHVFDDVTAVLFCVALDEYNLKMREDESVWRIHESLQLFNEIANSTHLSRAAIILFLNKKDLFAEKISKEDLTVTFPEYAGGRDYAKAAEYLTVQFCSLMKQRERLYTHLTCATDTDNISVVFSAIQDMLLHRMLGDAL